MLTRQDALTRADADMTTEWHQRGDRWVQISELTGPAAERAKEEYLRNRQAEAEAQDYADFHMGETE